MLNKDKKPNINLRVFRREKTDMALIYNNSELLSLYEDFDLTPEIYINNKKLQVLIERARAKDVTSNDICIFIPYEENNLNEEDRYELSIIFKTKLKPYNGYKSISVKNEELKYNIIIEPRGILPSSIKDNKNMFSQSFGYNPAKNRWTKMHIMETEDDYNKLIVQDNKVIELLIQIRDLLLSKNS